MDTTTRNKDRKTGNDRSFPERFNFPSKLSVIYDTTFEFTAQEKEEKF
jgi:hypothetical protein